MRAAMERHRANPACASCHAQMDPLGFALENFDAVGRWREHGESDEPIDATGILPDGTAFAGPEGMRQALLRNPDRFVATVAEKLLTYALGRNLESYDMPAVRAIVRDAASDRHRFSSLVLGIVQSTPVPDEDAPIMTIFQKSLPRRTFLRGVGATLALPLLDAMVPAASWSSLARAAAAPTRRLGFIYVPNGVIQEQWVPAATGRGFPFSRILSPLEPFREQLLVLSGLAHRQADSFGDGNGDHPRATAVWLSGVHAWERRGRQGPTDIKLGVTADQIAARELGQETPLPSLELALEQPTAIALRHRRLLLLEHHLVAHRDDAARHGGAPARRLRAAVRRGGERRRPAGRGPPDRQHPRLGDRGGGAARRDARPGRSQQAGRVPHRRARRRAADSSAPRRAAPTRSSICRSGRSTFRRSSRTTPG